MIGVKFENQSAAFTERGNFVKHDDLMSCYLKPIVLGAMKDTWTPLGLRYC